MKVRGLARDDAKDRVKWRAVMGSKRLTPTTVGKMASNCFFLYVFSCI